jgi:hypothetical protein
VQTFFPSSWLEVSPGSYIFSVTLNSQAPTTMYLAVGKANKGLLVLNNIGPAGSAPILPSLSDNITVANDSLPAEIVIFNPLLNPRVHFVVRLPDVSATTYGASLTADLAAVVAAQGSLTSPEWAQVLLIATLPVTANITVSSGRRR